MWRRMGRRSKLTSTRELLTVSSPLRKAQEVGLKVMNRGSELQIVITKIKLLDGITQGKELCCDSCKERVDYTSRDESKVRPGMEFLWKVQVAPIYTTIQHGS